MRNVASPSASGVPNTTTVADAGPVPAVHAPAAPPPPKTHAEALDRLMAAAPGEFSDPGHTVRLLLPDAERWALARIIFTKTMFILRYGAEPDALIGGGLVHVANERLPGACIERFEERTRYWVETFRVNMKHDPASALLFRGAVADVDSLIASTEGFLGHDEYVAAYGAFPAWPGTCVIVGISIPVMGEMKRARALRERFIRETLPSFQLVSPEPPKTLY